MNERENFNSHPISIDIRVKTVRFIDGADLIVRSFGLTLLFWDGFLGRKRERREKQWRIGHRPTNRTRAVVHRGERLALE